MNKSTLLILIVAASFIVAIFGAMIGTKAGAATCDCRKKSDAGWMGFSIVWFMGSVVAIGFALLWAFKPGYAENLLSLGAPANRPF